MPPLSVRVSSKLDQVLVGIRYLYSDYAVLDDDSFYDFRVELDCPISWRHWVRPKVTFRCDDQTPFEPLPATQAFALLEWGLNWCFTNNRLHMLLVHAAVVETDGAALVLPGEPGSGKSTLCAALVHRGWRLLSDELGVFDLRTALLHPFPRPISLKNASIDLIRHLDSTAVFGPVARDTVKGTVAHLRPPQSSVERAALSAQPRWIVFPRYASGSPTRIEALPPARVFMNLAENSFNYALHGAAGFDCLSAIVDGSRGYAMDHANLDEALTAIDELTRISAPCR